MNVGGSGHRRVAGLSSRLHPSASACWYVMVPHRQHQARWRGRPAHQHAIEPTSILACCSGWPAWGKPQWWRDDPRAVRRGPARRQRAYHKAIARMVLESNEEEFLIRTSMAYAC